METLMEKPSAWVPIELSALVLLTEIYFLKFGGVPQPQADEGAAAHLFQIWLVIEFVAVLLFAVRWVPKKPFPATRILIIQIAAALGGTVPVFYFHL